MYTSLRWRPGALIAALWLVMTPLRAQAAPGFALDTVLVATFEPIPRELESEAERLRSTIERSLSETVVVLPIDEVPAFTAFSAEVYMAACPDGAYVECALVLGIRGGVEWVVGGQVRATDRGLQLTVSIISVRDANLIHQVDYVLDTESDASVLEQLKLTVDHAQEGFYNGEDIRRTEVSEDETGLTAREQVLAEGASLQAYDEEVGAFDRGDARRGPKNRLRVAELRRYDGMEGGTPWARIGLGKQEYVRFRNSGSSLTDWRRRQRGRMQSLLIHTTLATLGQGPWRQDYDAWYALESTNLQQVEQLVVLDQARMLDRSWEMGLSYGILEWLEVGGFVGPRISVFQHRVQRIVEEEEPRYRDPDQVVVTTWQAGGQVGFVPFPTFVVRPSLHVAAMYWSGNRQERVIEVLDTLPSVERNWMFLLGIRPGFEASLGKHILLWGRAHVDIPLAGRVAQQVGEPRQLLTGTGHPVPNASDDGIQIAGSLGVTLRIRLTKSLRRHRNRGG